MKIILYFLIYSCLILGLFSTFLYLMTRVDPGLVDLPAKAALMMAYVEDKDDVILPPEQYIDIGNVLANNSRAMSKATLFVSIYSVVLIAMFSALCYLMTMVDPKVSGDLEGSKRFEDAEYLFDSKELPAPNDIVAYGLEKVTNEYELYENDAITSTRVVQKSKLTSDVSNIAVECTSEAEVPKPWLSQKEKDNFTKQFKQIEIFTTITNSIKPIKDLKRSINDDKQEKHDEMPRSLLLKIKDVGRQPRIEIKIVSNKFKNKKTPEYRNFGTKNKLISDALSKINDNNTRSENNKSTSIIIGENGTFMLSVFPNMIDLITINETTEIHKFESNRDNNLKSKSNSPKTSGNISNDEKNYKFNPVLNFTTDMENGNKIDTLKTDEYNMTNNTYRWQNSMTVNKNENISRHTLNEDNTSTIIDKNLLLSTGKNTSRVKLKISPTDIPISPKKGFSSSLGSQAENGAHENEGITGMTRDNKSSNTHLTSNSLVGLLIPEATATLPFNYHFIN